MRPPHILELISRVRVEAIVTAVGRVSMVRSTDLDHSSVVRIKSKESIGELTIVESSVTTGVIPSDEEVKLILSGEDTDRVQTRSELVRTKVPIAVRVKHIEGIVEVKVRLHGELGLLSLDVILIADQVSQTVHELVLVGTRKHGLAAGARVAGHGLGDGSRRRRVSVGAGGAEGRAGAKGRAGAHGRGVSRG